MLLRKLNYRNIVLSGTFSGESVGILRRNGELFYTTWLGFIDVDDALKLPEAKPVKLKIAAYALEQDMPANWIDLVDYQMIQGCYVGKGAYGVTCNGIPRLVTTRIQ